MIINFHREIKATQDQQVPLDDLELLVNQEMQEKMENQESQVSL